MTLPAPSSAATDTQPIRDAACVVVIDDGGAEPRLLLGRRRIDQVFLPDKWVFPGGRVDPDDHTDAGAPDTRAACAALAAVRPFAFAAVRELFEETGLILGEAVGSPEGVRDASRALAARGYLPAIHALSPLARAITPPGRPRRYDTWFFLTYRRSITAEREETDGELLDLGWFTLAETRRLDLPNITRLILDDVALRLAEPASPPGAGIPFYFQDTSGFQRMLIELGCGGPRS